MKVAQDDVRRHHERVASLEEDLDVRTRELKEQALSLAEVRQHAERATAATVAKGEFLTNMSHEIRTP